jgi:putative membrane protein insertion efficiency factor
MKFLSLTIRALFPPVGVAGAPLCKYHPTCSQYASDAIRKYGLLFGSAKAVWRLLRCNPWSRGGVDYA